MKKMLLVTAILHELKDVTQQQKSVSAYDITAAIRARVNANEYSVSDVITLSSGAPDIQHARVKEIISELFDGDFLSFTRSNNGMYWVYTPVNAPVNAPVGQGQVPVATQTDSEEEEDACQATQCCQTNQAGQTNQVSQETLEDLVLGYIERKSKRGEIPTLKSVQSALKNYHIATTTIEDICRNNGFKVNALQGLKPSLAIIYK